MSNRPTDEVRVCNRRPAPYEVRMCLKSKSLATAATFPASTNIRCRCSAFATSAHPTTGVFAVYLASNDGYEDSILPNDSFTGTPAEALDCPCGLYLNDLSMDRGS